MQLMTCCWLAGWLACRWHIEVACLYGFLKRVATMALWTGGQRGLAQRAGQARPAQDPTVHTFIPLVLPSSI